MEPLLKKLFQDLFLNTETAKRFLDAVQAKGDAEVKKNPNFTYSTSQKYKYLSELEA